MQNIKRTFIVDDDPFWTEILKQILEDLGHENILTFRNGNECLQNLHLNPNTIFLDYEMEDMNGLEVLKHVKNYFPGIGVIFCTGVEDLSVAMKAINSGSFDYLLKANVSKKEVAKIIESLKQQQTNI